MSNLTPEELWSAVHEISAGEAVQGGPDGNDNVPHQHLLNRIEFLSKRIGVQGVWDMTGPAVPITPNNGSAIDAAAALSSGEVYTFTPNDVTSALTKIVPATQSVLTAGMTGEQWASFVVPAVDGGDNVDGWFLCITNADATAADIAATIDAAPSLVGTVTHMAVLVNSGGNAILYALSPSVSPNVLGAVIAGDVISIGIDYDAGNVMGQINAGAVTSAATDLPASGAVRVSLGVKVTASPIVFLAGTANFSFGTTTGGKTAFMGAGSPTPPAGAAAGKKYLVSVAGSFNGRAASVGDIVEFHSGTSLIQVLPATTMTAAAVTAIAQAEISAVAPAAWKLLSIASLAKSVARIIDISNDGTGVTTDVPGESQLVGNAPSGDWSAYASYSLCVWDGVSWVNIPATAVEDTYFAMGPTTSAPNGTLLIRDADRAAASYYRLLIGSALLGSASVGETDMGTSGWLLTRDNENGTTTNAGGLVYVLNSPGATVAVDVVSGIVTVDLDTTNGIISINDTSSNAADYAMLLRLRNIGAVECRVSMSTGFGSSMYRHFAPNEQRLFMVSRDINNAGVLVAYEIESRGTWSQPALSGTWANLAGEQPFEYMKKGDDLRIRLSVGSGTAATIYTLPAGYRPAADITVPVAVYETGGGVALPGHLKILTTGEVNLVQPSPGGTHRVWGSFTIPLSLN